MCLGASLSLLSEGDFSFVRLTAFLALSPRVLFSLYRSDALSMYVELEEEKRQEEEGER